MSSFRARENLCSLLLRTSSSLLTLRLPMPDCRKTYTVPVSANNTSSRNCSNKRSYTTVYKLPASTTLTPNNSSSNTIRTRTWNHHHHHFSLRSPVKIFATEQTNGWAPSLSVYYTLPMEQTRALTSNWLFGRTL